MDVDQRLEELAILIEEAKAVPLSASCMDNRAQVLDMIEDISEWQEHLKSQVELADMAFARLAVVSSAILYRNAERA